MNKIIYISGKITGDENYAAVGRENYELIEEIRIGRNYIFLIDVPELPDRGFMRLFLNGVNYQSGGTIEYGKKRLAQFAEGIRNKTLRVSYDTPLYYD